MKEHKLRIFLMLMFTIASTIEVLGLIKPAFCEEQPTTNILRKTSDAGKELAFATNYNVILAIKPLTLDQMQDSQAFVATRKDTGENTLIKRVTYSGFPAKDENTGAILYTEAILWGDFKPGIAYHITINYPDGTLGSIEISAISGQEKSTFLQWFGHRLNLGIEPMFVEQTKDIGFKYNASFTPWASYSVTRQIKIIKFSITSKGELSTNLGNKQIQSSITNGFDFSLRLHPRLTIPIPGSGEKRQYIYPVVFEIKPVEFESNQDFKITNYTCKIQLAFALPYSDWPILWWHIKTGVNRPFFPLVISSGYTLVKNVKNPSSIDSIAINHRWDSDIYYTFPVSNKIDFSGEFKAFMDIKEKTFNKLFDISLKYYLTDDYKSGFVVSYQNGELPPEYKDVKSLRLGLDFAFF